jgi:hypothetical protein
MIGAGELEDHHHCATSAIVSTCNRSGHDHRATCQAAISKTAINARRPPPEGYVAGDVTLPHHRRQPPLEAAKKIAEPAVAIALGVNIPTFLPQDHQIDPRALHLPRLLRPVRLDPTPLARLEAGAREQPLLQRVVADLFRAARSAPPPPFSSNNPAPCSAPRRAVARSPARSARRGRAAASAEVVASSVLSSPHPVLLVDLDEA